MRLTEEQILEVAKILDDIITSDSVAVHSAFQRVALLCSLAKAERSDPGPFELLVRQLDYMESQLKNLQRQVQILDNKNLHDITLNTEYSIDTNTIVNLSGLVPNNTMAGSAGIDLSGLQCITLNPPHVSPLDPAIVLTQADLAPLTISDITILPQEKNEK